MGKEKEPKIKHPAYEKEDLKISTPEELEEVKKAAGATTHKEVIKRFAKADSRGRAWEKAPEKKFVQERDITDREWLEMKKEIEDIRSDNVYVLFDYAMRMKIISPERFKKEIEISDEEWKKMEETWRPEDNNGARAAMQMKIISPERFKKIKTKIDNRAWQAMSEKLEEKYEAGETPWSGPSFQAMPMKIVCPERFKKMNIDKEWQEMKRELGHLQKSNMLQSFSDLAMRMKIISPERFKKEIEISDEEWKKMEGELVHNREHRERAGWKDFVNQAMAMTVLAADKVEVDENGLKIE